MVTFASPFGLIMSTRERVCLLNGTLSVTSAHLGSLDCLVKDMGAATGAAIITGAAVGGDMGAENIIEAVGAAMDGGENVDAAVTVGADPNIVYPALPTGVFEGEAPKSIMPIGVGGMVPPEAKFIGFGTAIFLSLT